MSKHLLSLLTGAHYWIVLDRDHRVVERCADLAYTHAIGASIWSVSHPYRAVLEPLYLAGWQNGHTESVEFMRGQLFRMEVNRIGDLIRVEAWSLDQLQTDTLETLEVSLHRIASRLADEAASAASPPLLRVV